MVKYFSRFLQIAIIVGLIAGCGADEENVLGPDEAAREWIDAIVNQDGNKILKHTCKEQRENVQDTGMWISAFAVLGQLLTNRSVQIEGDISDLKFETISQSNTQAEVRVYGELRMAVLAKANAFDVDESWQMIYENDTWRWCGSNTDTTLPLAQFTPTPRHTSTPLPTKTSTSTPSPTEIVVVATDKAGCSFPVGDLIVKYWETKREDLGCPVNEQHDSIMMVQRFENGEFLYWRDENSLVFTKENFGADEIGTYKRFLYFDGVPNVEKSADLVPPNEKKHWNAPAPEFADAWEQLGGAQTLGWGSETMEGSVITQDFENGFFYALADEPWSINVYMDFNNGNGQHAVIIVPTEE